MFLNKVLLIGNLTRDVTLRNTPSGQSVADFGLATNRTWVNGQGEKKQEAEFHNIVVWGKMADLCSRYLSKGSLVFIEGRIRTRSWVDQNGNKRYRTEIIAENVRFGPRRDQGDFLKPPSSVDEISEDQIETTEDLPILEEDNSSGEKSDNDFSNEDEDITPDEIPF